MREYHSAAERKAPTPHATAGADRRDTAGVTDQTRTMSQAVAVSVRLRSKPSPGHVWVPGSYLEACLRRGPPGGVVRFVIIHVHCMNFCPYGIFQEKVSLGVALF